MRFFGKYSYAMYVFQNLLLFSLEPYFSAQIVGERIGSDFLGRLVYLGVMFAATTLTALVSWHLFEKHFLALKSRFESH